jgi:DnaK suppressor protein
MAKKTAAVKKTPAKKAEAVKLPGALASIRKMLLVMREDLTRTVRKQQVADAALQDIGDAADQASQSVEKELLFELSDNERMQLDQVEAALRKIDKGTYGVCESCRKPIGKARLEALPFARYCISCQSSSESLPEMAAEGPDFRSIGDEPRSEAT